MCSITSFIDFSTRKIQKENLLLKEQQQNAELNLVIHNYHIALAEAVLYIQSRQPIPEKVIAKAIGSKPSSSLNSESSNTIFFKMEECREYQLKRDLFLYKAETTAFPIN